MKRLLGIVIVAAGCGVAGAQDPVTGIDWRKSLTDARAEARQTGKPMLVVFR